MAFHGTPTRRIERHLGDWMRARLPSGLADLVMFVLKQGWSCLFGGLMLAGLIISAKVWQDEWDLARYDALLIYAVCLQVLFVVLRLETWREVKIIALFHLSGTLMELFKVNVGSWVYPEPALTKLWGVPLFSGFMYASVGSYMARVIRVFDMRFTPFPPYWMTPTLALAIYVNFFSHHYVPDMRYLLFAATVLLYLRTRVWFVASTRPLWMPMPLAALLTSGALWIAENIGTNTGTWLYAGQAQFEMVSLAKMGSWYLLLYVSFATVTLVVRDALDCPVKQSRARSTRSPEAPPTPEC
ncbi:MAG: DUF817 domain-containing protein [Rhodobacteraceae bacterium]|nr:DUF817 domain-containing protein [Paracoccaceae bacterium]